MAAGDITGRHIKRVAELINGSLYYGLGTELNFTYNELDKLATPPTGGPTQYAARVLNKWHNEHASMTASEVRRALVGALRESGRADVAAEVTTKLWTENDIEKVFQDISGKLVKDWRHVGICLGIPDDNLQAAKAYLDLQEEPVLRMLQMWQQRTAPLDQRSQLITALRELKLQHVIRAIEDIDKKRKEDLPEHHFVSQAWPSGGFKSQSQTSASAHDRYSSLIQQRELDWQQINQQKQQQPQHGFPSQQVSQPTSSFPTHLDRLGQMSGITEDFQQLMKTNTAPNVSLQQKPFSQTTIYQGLQGPTNVQGHIAPLSGQISPQPTQTQPQWQQQSAQGRIAGGNVTPITWNANTGPSSMQSEKVTKTPQFGLQEVHVVKNLPNRGQGQDSTTFTQIGQHPSHTGLTGHMFVQQAQTMVQQQQQQQQPMFYNQPPRMMSNAGWAPRDLGSYRDWGDSAGQPTTRVLGPCSKATEEEDVAMKYKDFLQKHGFEWFLHHDCAPYDLKKTIVDPDITVTREYARKRLNEEKLKIENSIKLTQLTCAGSGQPRSNKPLRCILLGKTGDGKSSLGNLLLGRMVFGVGNSAQSETHTIQYGHAADLEIIDTPGFGDPNKAVDAEFEITKIFESFKEGIHSFIYVFSISNPRVGNEDVKIFQKIKDMFGDKMKAHTIVVLTHSDQQLCNRSLKDYVASVKHTDLGEIIDIIDTKVIAVDNASTGYKRELHREGVIDMIRQSVQHALLCGHGECYTPTFFREAKNALEVKKIKRREKLEAEEREADRVVLELLNRELAVASMNRLLELHYYKEKQASLVEKVVGSVPHQCREYARKGGMKTLKAQVDSRLHRMVIELVQTHAVNYQYNVGTDYYMQSIEAYNGQLVQAVGRKRVSDIVGMRLRELYEEKKKQEWLARIKQMEAIEAQAAQDRQDREARLIQDMEADVKQYVTQNIAFHDKPHDIVNGILERNVHYDRQKTQDMVQRFLWSSEGRALVDTHMRAVRDRLRRAAVSEMEKHVGIGIRTFLSEKTRSEMRRCQTDTAYHAKHTDLIVQHVRRDLSQHHLDVLTDTDICDTVVESLNESIENVNNANWREKVCMAFSFLFGKKYTRELMEKYARVKNAVSSAQRNVFNS